MYIFHELDKIAKFDGARVGGGGQEVRSIRARRAIVVIKPNKEGIKGDKRHQGQVRGQVARRRSIQPDVDPREAKRPIKVAAELKALVGAQRFTARQRHERRDAADQLDAARRRRG